MMRLFEQRLHARHSISAVCFLATMVARCDDKRAICRHPASGKFPQSPVDGGREIQRSRVDPQLDDRRDLIGVLAARASPGEMPLIDRIGGDG